jgi:hypothetical protein
LHSSGRKSCDAAYSTHGGEMGNACRILVNGPEMITYLILIQDMKSLAIHKIGIIYLAKPRFTEN